MYQFNRDRRDEMNMELRKHNTELAERIQILDIPTDSQIAKELMENHQAKCTSCQEDRLTCTVRPACKDRNFLNMLIELGIEPQNLPKFCYSIYLDQLRRYILEKKGRGMKDRRLLIKDLLSTLRVSSIRHFNTRFKKEWKHFSRASENNIMLVAGDSLMFHFDFSRGIVVVNPLQLQIETLEVFRLYVQLLSEYHSLKVSVSDITLNWWVLKLEAGSSQTPSEINKLFEETAQRFESFQIDIGEKTAHIHVETIIDGKQPPIVVGDLKELFKLVASLKRKKRTQ
ncbi:MAG: hypothetical protein ACXADL_02405 [Candidatus Thorarchaeota archaeon]